MSSCIFEPEPPVNPDGKQLLVLHITPLEAGSTESGDTVVTEMIKTLRVIMLGNGSVEANELITIDSVNGVPASDFEYDITFSTNPGPKTFYLIANEESVTDLKYQDDGGLPSELPTTLTGLLDKYPFNSYAGEFETVINSVYFTPAYSPDSNKRIFLPYTSSYQNIMVEKQEGTNTTSASMYLVPAATKFKFRFINYREYPVEIDNITVLNKNDSQFLLARVEGDDYEKQFGGVDYYWVDWLAKVSDYLHSIGYSQNTQFNEAFGWISNYQMPTTSTNVPAEFIGGGNTQSVAGVTVVTDDDNLSETTIPGYLVLGPYYITESKNLYTYKDPEKDENVTVQRYGLTLRLRSTGEFTSGKNPLFEDVAIDNLKALFRNTAILITVVMNEGDIEIYGQIQPWNIKSANGWVIEGGTPNPNPFSLIRKH